MEQAKNKHYYRLFIPLLDNKGDASKISLHFGHAPYFGLYDFKDRKLEIIKNNLDHVNPSKSPVDQIIESMNPDAVFAEDMGARAIELFSQKNIVLLTGPYKTVREILANLNSLEKLNNSCGH